MFVAQLEQNADSNGVGRIDLDNKMKSLTLGSGVKIRKKNPKQGDGVFFTWCILSELWYAIVKYIQISIVYNSFMLLVIFSIKL